MDEQLTTIIVAFISVLGGAGFWGWMQHKSKLAYAAKAADKADKNEFRESLKAQVDMLQQENKDLREKVEQLLKEMAEVKAALAAANATIKHLEEQLRNR
jgi:peptidoglycan hydrolase CwlO-like protein